MGDDMTALHTIAAVWLWAVAIAGVGVLAWVGGRMLWPTKRPATATLTTYTSSAGQRIERATYMRRRAQSGAFSARIERS